MRPRNPHFDVCSGAPVTPYIWRSTEKGVRLPTPDLLTLGPRLLRFPYGTLSGMLAQVEASRGFAAQGGSCDLSWPRPWEGSGSASSGEVLATQHSSPASPQRPVFGSLGKAFDRGAQAPPQILQGPFHDFGQGRG